MFVLSCARHVSLIRAPISLSLSLSLSLCPQELPGFDDDEQVSQRVEVIDPIPVDLQECNQAVEEELTIRTMGEPERTLPEVPDTLLGTDTGVIADGSIRLLLFFF